MDDPNRKHRIRKACLAIALVSILAAGPLPIMGGQAQLENVQLPQTDIGTNPEGWTINFGSIPDNVPQGRLTWDPDEGILDPQAPGGPCLLQPTGARTGALPLALYYENGRTGSNTNAPLQLPRNLVEPLPDCAQDQQGEPGAQAETPQADLALELGNYLNAFGTLGVSTANNPEAPSGEVYVVPQSVRWVLQRCDLGATQFEPGQPNSNGVTMSRAVAFCAPTDQPVDLSNRLSVDASGAGMTTQYDQPRLGTLFPAGSGSSLVVSCVQLDLVEYAADGSEHFFPGVASHDWFVLADGPLDVSARTLALDTSRWYDLSGDNGCPVPIPPPTLPPGLPLVCYDSNVRSDGVPSTHPDADYDGPVHIRFQLGVNRVLVGERVDAPTVPVQSHDDNPSVNLHDWGFSALDPGFHEIQYTVRTECPWPNLGDPETFVVSVVMREPGSKCKSNGNPIGAVTPFVVGFRTLPAGLVVGGTYNTGVVTLIDSVLKFAALDVSVATFDVFARQTNDDANAIYCEVDGIALATFVPNDPQYGTQQYGPQQIHAPAAWDTTLGTTAKTVCIIDTGVRYTHQDLTGARWLGGYDFVNSDADPWDDQGHGTHVAGIAAATTNNALGIAGIAKVGIKAVKVLGASGSGTWANVATGIRWCADNGGDVINLSLGGTGAGTAVSSAVTYAWATKGKILVASAGNSGPCTNCVGQPASFTEAIAVSCTTNTEAQCGFSSEGPQVDLAAPGNNVRSTCFASNTDYCNKSGTSMSAPHVAGAAALIWSHVTGLTNAQVRQYLECKAKDLGASGPDDKFGKGLVQVKESLDAAIAGTCVTSVPCTASLSVSGSSHGPGTWRGGARVTLTHSGTYHATGYTMSTSPYYAYSVSSAGHDSWWISGSNDYGTRRVTFTVYLPACGSVSTSFYIYN